jgi:hypothetical protein
VEIDLHPPGTLSTSLHINLSFLAITPDTYSTPLSGYEDKKIYDEYNCIVPKTRWPAGNYVGTASYMVPVIRTRPSDNKMVTEGKIFTDSSSSGGAFDMFRLNLIEQMQEDAEEVMGGSLDSPVDSLCPTEVDNPNRWNINTTLSVETTPSLSGFDYADLDSTQSLEVVFGTDEKKTVRAVDATTRNGLEVHTIDCASGQSTWSITNRYNWRFKGGQNTEFYNRVPIEGTDWNRSILSGQCEVHAGTKVIGSLDLTNLQNII